MWETCQDTLFSKRKKRKKHPTNLDSPLMPFWNTRHGISSHILLFWYQESDNIHYLRPQLPLVLKLLFNAQDPRLCAQTSERPKIQKHYSSKQKKLLERFCLLLVWRELIFAITNSNRISTKPSAKQTQLHCWGYKAIVLSKIRHKKQNMLASCNVFSYGFYFISQQIWSKFVVILRQQEIFLNI